VSTTYFNKGSSSGSGDSPFYKLKPIPLINKTNIVRDDDFSSVSFTHIPVWRSAAANNYFVSAGTTTSLYSINAAGVASLVGTSTFNTYLTSSSAACFFLSTSDQCLYVLLYASPQYRLIKISDTLGTTTTIGSAFTPSSATRWPTQIPSDPATMLDDGTGSIKVYFRGYTHQINKTTGKDYLDCVG